MAARGDIKVTRNFTLRTDRILTPDTVREMGLMLLVEIENRTVTRGRDENQAAFKPYSAWYGTHIKGRRSPVDLKRTGAMINDMAVITASSRLLQLGFRSSAMAQRAAYHDSEAPRTKMPLRRFLGLQPTWITKALRTLKLDLPAPGMRRPV